MKQDNSHFTPWMLVRLTLCSTAIGIIITRPFTHNPVATVATCVVVGLIVGWLLRLYIEMNQ